MIPVYVKKLRFQIWKTDVEVQKIDSSSLVAYSMVIAGLKISDKLGKTCFFQEIFIMTDSNIDVILRMFYSTLSNTNVLLADQKLIQRFYTTAKSLSITQQIKIIDKN